MSRRWRLLLGERLDGICYLDARDFRQARFWGIARFPKAAPTTLAPETEKPTANLDSLVSPSDTIELEIDGELIILKLLDI
jgi:hypothetical protein